MKIKLPDGSEKEVAQGATAYIVALSISEGLARASVAARINGVVRGLDTGLKDGDTLELIKFDSPVGKEVFWHTTSHIMAQAVKSLYPDVKVTIGPAIDAGFYYDFDTKTPLSNADFEAIEKKMAEIAGQKLLITRKELSRSDAISFFSGLGETYKVEIINGLPENEPVSVYTQGDFTDLCRGPHLPDTGRIKAVKLLSIAGAYWRGDEKNPMLQRLYGISFPDKKELNDYLTFLEEAKKRDHRKIGRELNLFSFHEEGPGFPFFHPDGMTLYNTLIDYMRGELKKRGYGEVRTPIILSEALWHTSGHYDNFRESMYFSTIDERPFAIKPMSCPGCLLIFKSSVHSYRELPLRLAEFGHVHRHELSGVLHGLFRVRAFTQDDAHSFCTPDQLQDEILRMVEFVMDVYRTMGFSETEVFIATRPQKFIGSESDWTMATDALKTSLRQKGIPFKIKEGEGAFYGPKIEFNIKDCLKRNWQCGTIQVDFSMPKRFELEYVGEDGNPHTPVMIHRAILGSIERFLGVMIEHYSGDFPLWLSPRQVVIIPVSRKFLDYSESIMKRLTDEGLRVDLDRRDEKVGYKIRDGENSRIPCMMIIGEKEATEGTVSVRRRKSGDLGSFKLDDIINKLKTEIADKQQPETLLRR